MLGKSRSSHIQIRNKIKRIKSLNNNCDELLEQILRDLVDPSPLSMLLYKDWNFFNLDFKPSYISATYNWAQQRSDVVIFQVQKANYLLALPDLWTGYYQLSPYSIGTERSVWWEVQ